MLNIVALAPIDLPWYDIISIQGGKETDGVDENRRFRAAW